MNIWTFHHYSTPPSMTGLTRPYYFAKNLKEYGQSIVFSSAYLHYSNENLIKNKDKFIIHEEDVPFVFIRTTEYKKSKLNRVFNLVSFVLRLSGVTKLIEKQFGKPDVIIASSPHPLTLVAGIKIARRYKVPCICEVRDLWPEAIFFNSKKIKEKSVFGRILTWGEHWIYKNADALIFTKEGDTDYIKEHKWDLAQDGNIDLRKCHYINNGVDIEEYQKSIESNILYDEDLENNKFNVIYCGTIRPVNNVEYILNCAALLKDEFDIQFLIYGEGSLLADLKEKSEKENLTNIKFKGYVEKKYIPYILSKSSLNILNYSADRYNWSRGNSSNKLFEYMASGKPILSTVKMGYCILSRYNCGFSLDECTPQAMADAVIKIKNMPEDEWSELGRNAYNGAKDFDFKVLAEKLMKVIESVNKKD